MRDHSRFPPWCPCKTKSDHTLYLIPLHGYFCGCESTSWLISMSSMREATGMYNHPLLKLHLTYRQERSRQCSVQGH